MSFIETVKDTGCNTFIIHARKAWLNGLSPKENREIPPLRYDVAAAVKKAYPDLKIILNGGITKIDQITSSLSQFDGVMIGREAYHNPCFLTDVERHFYDHIAPDRTAIALAMIPYMEQQARDFGTPVKTIVRHMMGLFAAQPCGRIWRQILSTESCKKDTTPSQLITFALNRMNEGHNVADAA
jgi:tRNA-dihydrouridine synthase A